ncbi:MAG: hypothetical protein ABFS23_09120 [Pseudomonadota bacterium]
MRRNFITLLLAVVLAAMAACQTNVSRKVGIEQALFSFEKTLRWRSVRESYKYVADDVRPPHLPSWVDTVKVVGYEVLDPAAEIQRNTVVQTAEIRYVHTDTQIMRTLVDEQVWTSPDDGKTWQRANPMPDFY